MSVFSPNTGKYGPEKNPCLDTFHAVIYVEKSSKIEQDRKSMVSVSCNH